MSPQPVLKRVIQIRPNLRTKVVTDRLHVELRELT